MRDIWFGRVWRANAARVVVDRDDLVVMWIPAGSAWVYPVRADGTEIRLPQPTATLARRVTDRCALALQRPGARHSIWLFWSNRTFDYWYVNFERTAGWNGSCFDMVDDKLDLIVHPSGEIEWKDEDELADAVALGLVDAGEVRAEAERVLARWPFPTGWESFQPNPSWPVPRLPADWQSPTAG
jgi:Protein of unknown function (DUF402)